MAFAAQLVGCDGTGHSPPTESSAKFTDFSFVRPGIVLELHPADSPIHLSATADVPTSTVIRFREGKVVSMQDYRSEAEALAAAK